MEQPPPFDVDAFRLSCEPHLTADQFEQLCCVLDGTPCATGQGARWWAREVQIRNALARHRASAWNADASAYERSFSGFDVSLDRAVNAALNKENPLESERALDEARWAMLEEMAQEDAFGFCAVLAYAGKLRLAARWAKMDREQGESRVSDLIDGFVAQEERLNELANANN